MMCVTRFLYVFYFLQTVYCIRKKHVVYWDISHTPELQSGKYNINVKIGEFMDILCPHDLVSNQSSEIFDLYNVTENQFTTCDKGDLSNLLFSCDRPEQENKLTIKFQVISPSPFGFRFQYCQDYFLIGKLKSDHMNTCHERITRLRISVACKNQARSKANPTTTSKPSSISTSKETDSYLDFIRNLTNQYRLKEDISDYEPILIPKLVLLQKMNNHSTDITIRTLSSDKEQIQTGTSGKSRLFKKTCSIILSILLLILTQVLHKTND